MGAAWSNHAGIVKLLLEAGADKNAQDEDGATALQHAARFDCEAVVEAVPRREADPGDRRGDVDEGDEDEHADPAAARAVEEGAADERRDRRGERRDRVGPGWDATSQGSGFGPL